MRISHRRRITELSEWAKVLDLDERSFLSLLREVPFRVRGEVSSVEIINGSLHAHLRSWPAPVPLEGHPGDAAIWTVLFEAAIALAQVHSQTGPALLLIDDFGDFFHPALVKKMFRQLTDVTRGFQTVVVTHHILPAEVQEQWTVTTLGTACNLLSA